MFGKRCVVCLDILGFKNLVADAEKGGAGLQRLLSLRTVLDAHVTWDNESLESSVPATHVPKYLFVSGTVIVSTPADPMGARAAIVKSIQISQKALELGHLLRGAMVIGNAWHDDRNIFGTGWIEAFYAQEKDAIHPRIIVSTEISELLEPDIRDAMLLKDFDDRWICDVFHPYYIRQAGLHGGIEDFYRQVRAWIVTSVVLHDEGSSPRSKWEWAGNFFKKAIARHGYNADQL
jgi:hypothetical protein